MMMPAASTVFVMLIIAVLMGVVVMIGMAHVMTIMMRTTCQAQG